MISARMPAARAVRTASATNRAAPRAEFADPFRSRVAAITGADDGVEAVARNAFKPFTPGVPVPGALLGVTVGLADRVIDVDERDIGGRREQRCMPGQTGQEPG